MKIKIKNYNGELPDYLTAGKVYEVDDCSDLAGYLFITDDMGYTRSITLKNCWYLNGGYWEVCND